MIYITIDAHVIRSQVNAMEDSTFKQYFLNFWLADKWLGSWIDATRPANCESKGLWRTNNYTEAQIKRICHTYLKKKQAISFSEYLKVLGSDMIVDTTTFAQQLSYGEIYFKNHK